MNEVLIRLDDYDFDLPSSLLARLPREDLGQKRDDARLLVMHRHNGAIEHVLFRDIINYLEPGDALILNDTKVIPSVLFGQRENGGQVEVLIFCNRGSDEWEAIIKPSRDLKVGTTISFGNGRMKGYITNSSAPRYRVKFSYEGDFYEILDELGTLCLSMYTKEFKERSSYDTVYASKPGAVEMPAAGRHFTQELLEKIKNKGINIGFITLHVGLSSMSISSKNIEEKKLGEEWCHVSQEIADLVNSTKQTGHKVIACGTTVTRSLETAAGDDGIVHAWEGFTDLFILPGYQWKVCSAIITNFHQPKTSRLLLAVAFEGWDLIKKAYEEAIQKEYLFYEFGDSTLMLP